MIRIVLGLAPLLALAACGGGTINLGDTDGGDPPSEECPGVSVSPDAVAFEPGAFDGPSAAAVTVTNNCLDDEGDLVFTAEVDAPGFVVTGGASATLAPGESAEVAVTYTPSTYEPVEAVLQVETNVPGRTLVEVPLTGTTGTDQDGDGFEAAEVGGEDCDDLDSAIFPGATEIWYDGIDQDCAGDDDFDQDGDGFVLDEDCNDTDPSTFPGAGEVDDMTDNDCDTLVDEDFLRPGDVLVTEIMADPGATFDAESEWFEVQNTSERAVDLVGWTVSDLQEQSFTVGASVVLEPGDRVVFGVSEDIRVNGGVLVDVLYDRDALELDNESGTVALEAGERLVAQVDYDASFGLVAGTSMSLDPFFVNRESSSLGAFWCASTTPLPAGDAGTPARENDLCTSVDHDGDGFTIDDGDCEDFDAAIYPDAPELWNGIDDDCDGSIDRSDIDDLEDGWVRGERQDYLGALHSLSRGDIDDDGDLELLVGTSLSSTRDGFLYALDAASADTFAENIVLVDDAVFEGPGSRYMGDVGIEQGDVDGDGITDVVIGGRTSWFGTGESSLALFTEGEFDAGRLELEDAAATWSVAERAFFQGAVSSDLDLDGDGDTEIIWGVPSTNDASREGWRGQAVGAIHVIDGDEASGEAAAADEAMAVWYGTSRFDYLGSSVGGGDLDDDGYDDVVACAIYADEGATNSGACYVMFGGETLPETGAASDAARVVIEGSGFNQYVGGQGRTGLGDFDEDGVLDLAAAVPGEDDVRIWMGLGDLEGTFDTTDADVTVKSPFDGRSFGRAIDVGDMDGDGVDDLVVGSGDGTDYRGFGATVRGGVWVWSGTTLADGGRVDGEDIWASVRGRAVGDGFGNTVLVVDIDEDGQDDVIIGATSAESTAGRVSFLLSD